MPERNAKGEPRNLGIRDRRYSIRYPFAADVELMDLESGARAKGVTSDISMGVFFMCTSKTLPRSTRIRITLTRKDQKLEALGAIRIIKPRIGMGVEFIDVEPPYDDVLCRWVEELRKNR